MSGIDTLTELIDPEVTALGYELVGVDVHGSGRRQTVRIFIDSPQGVTLDDCETVSRQVSALLDVEDPIPDAYNLEVSSPGLDRPIFKRVDYDRFRGERIRIRLREQWEGRRRIRGVLGGLDGDCVRVEETDGSPLNVPLELIERARLDLDP